MQDATDIINQDSTIMAASQEELADSPPIEIVEGEDLDYLPTPQVATVVAN